MENMKDFKNYLSGGEKVNLGGVKEWYTALLAGKPHQRYSLKGWILDTGLRRVRYIDFFCN